MTITRPAHCAISIEPDTTWSIHSYPDSGRVVVSSPLVAFDVHPDALEELGSVLIAAARARTFAPSTADLDRADRPAFVVPLTADEEDVA